MRVSASNAAEIGQSSAIFRESLFDPGFGHGQNAHDSERD